jgi:hypothetical protein
LSLERIEVAASRVYDGDMATETTAKVSKPKVKPTEKPTVLEAYDALCRHRAFKRLRALKGKIHLDIDIDELRGRNR